MKIADSEVIPLRHFLSQRLGNFFRSDGSFSTLWRILLEGMVPWVNGTRVPRSAAWSTSVGVKLFLPTKEVFLLLDRKKIINERHRFLIRILHQPTGISKLRNLNVLFRKKENTTVISREIRYKTDFRVFKLIILQKFYNDERSCHQRRYSSKLEQNQKICKIFYKNITAKSGETFQHCNGIKKLLVA